MRGFSADFESILEQLEPAIALFNQEHALLWANPSLKKVMDWSSKYAYKGLRLDQFIQEVNYVSNQSRAATVVIDYLDIHHAIDKAIGQNRPLYFTQSDSVQNPSLPGAPVSTVSVALPIQIIPTASGYGLVLQPATAPTALTATAVHTQELGTLKSRFTSMISHEFRTPMSTILSAAELLEHYGHLWDTGDRLDQLHLIQQTVQHMTHVLDDILLISRSDNQPLKCQARWLNVTQFCQALVAENQRMATHHPLHLALQPQQIITWIDEKLLEQILTHVLANAVKYSPPGSAVNLEVVFTGDELWLTVRDRGIGIPAVDQEHLFEAFYRGSNVDTVPGTGIGLAIVRDCVAAHRGQISIASQVDQGTVVRIQLPIGKVAGA
jgi:signal transduction histidine kinase